MRIVTKPSWFKRTLWTVTSVGVVVVGFMLASAVFSILLVVGLAGAAWLWWRLHRLARQVQQAAPTVIDGEYTVESTHPLLEDRRDGAATHPHPTARRRR